MMAITLVLAFGMVWVSTRSKFVPYVVEVDKLGYAIGAPSALTESTSQINTDRMVRYQLAAFIRNAREVITDPAAEHQLIGQVYSRARGPGETIADVARGDSESSGELGQLPPRAIREASPRRS